MNDHEKPHVLPRKIYFLIGGSLLFLTIITVTVSFIDMGSLNLVIALGIASFKAALVALFFMHLYYDNKLYIIIFSTSLFFLTVLITLTIADTMRRGDIYEYRDTLITENAAMYDFLGPGGGIFVSSCGGCHVLQGDMGLPNQLKGLNEEFIYYFIDRLEHSRFEMTPFSGTDEERRLLANFLYSKTDKEYKFQSGEEVFNNRCNFCHTIDGDTRPIFDSFYGSTSDDVFDLIPIFTEQIELMVPWLGTDEELRMISDYIESWYKEGGSPKNP